MKELKNLIPAAVCLAFAPMLHGATIQFVDSLPTANVIASNPTPKAPVTASIQVRNLGGTNLTANRWVGFGFKAATSAALDQVTLFVDTANPPGAASNAGSLGAEMTISIYALTSQTAAPAESSAPLYSETATLPATYNGQGYMTFNLDQAWQLTANNFYGVVVSFSSSGNARGINLLQAASTVGGTGNVGYTFFTYDAGTSYTSSSSPVNYVIQTVPEASSASFLLFSGVASLVMATRRGVRKT